ncbi:MAG TPA: serine hydrolase, partial [Zoogloea sp.]|nr:serine hydrolase [Zoogloea sp.]
MPKSLFSRYWLFLCSLFILMAGFANPASADWGEGDYRIIKALYGTPERHVDVTSRLKELAQRDERFRLGNGVFGTDPDKGRVKTLRIEAVSSSGRNRTFEYTEGSWVDGSQFQGWSSGSWGDGNSNTSGWGERPGYQDRKEGDYRILQALYGTAERNVDVTRRLRELAGRDERFVLSNKTFGTDPDKGRVVYERYGGALRVDGQHIAQSVTKSFFGLIGQILVAEGKLDENAKVAQYVPELKDSAFGDATIRQVLDMRTGLKYSENYADPKAEIWDHVRAGGVLPRPPGWSGPQTFYDFLKTVQKEGEHGGAFAYKTVNSDVIG